MEKLFCGSCCRCDWCQQRDTKNNVDGVKYKKIDGETSKITNIKLPEYEKVPLQKIFHFQQPRRSVMHIHPQFIATDTKHIITQQPILKSSDSPIKAEDNKPKIQFSLYYDMQRCILTVHLIAGTNLMSVAHDRDQPDSFVLLFLTPARGQTFRSKVHNKTKNPEFYETFELTGLLSDEIRQQTLILRVQDKNNSVDNNIGNVVLPLENADLYGVKINAQLTVSTRTRSHPDSNGEVLISLKHNPSDELISGVLLKARNLKMDIDGSSDPYVMISVSHKGDDVCKWNSTIKKKTLAPIYNERFEFRIAGLDLFLLALEVAIKDNDNTLSPQNDLIGKVHIGYDSSHPTGRYQWMHMISSPKHLISTWHSLE